MMQFSSARLNTVATLPFKMQ